MKKILALVLAMMMVLCLAACGGSEAAPAAGGETCTVTFSTGETFEATVGEDFVFFFQCDAPGDMGAPAEGEEGAGITASEGTVAYSNVGLGGPYSYPTSEKVTISGFTGDFTVTVTDSAVSQGATYTIYTTPEEIADAIAYAEEMAAQMAANPIDTSASGEASGEAAAEPAAEGEASGEASAEQLASSGDYEITVDGVTGTAHYEDTDNGDQATKSYIITFNGAEITGTIDKGVWTADDAANQAVVDAVQAAFEGGNVVGPAA